VSRVGGVSFWVALLVGLAAVLASPPDGERASAVEGDDFALQLFIAGNGTVAVTDLDTGSTRSCVPALLLGNRGAPCLDEDDEELLYGAGTTLQMTASGSGSSSFVRWSIADCADSASCRVRIDDVARLVATFTPLEVHVIRAGSGTITPSPAPLASCTPAEGADICWRYAAGTEVALTGAATTPGAGVTWADTSWCTPDGAGSPTCRAIVSYLPQYVAVAFGTVPDEFGVPFQLDETVSVLKGGTGSGAVKGSGFDCGSTCTRFFPFSRRVSLTAAPDPGSRFVRWQGVCATDPGCTFAAGSTSSVRAIFDKVTAPPPPPPNGPNGPGPTGQTLRARVSRIAVGSRTRLLVTRVTVNEASSARARVLRGRRTVIVKTFRLKVGPNVLRVKLPRRTRPGRLRIVITVTDGSGERRTITRFARLAARRG
jgi:Divergent InlB B-repeat domain